MSCLKDIKLFCFLFISAQQISNKNWLRPTIYTYLFVYMIWYEMMWHLFILIRHNTTERNIHKQFIDTYIPQKLYSLRLRATQQSLGEINGNVTWKNKNEYLMEGIQTKRMQFINCSSYVLNHWTSIFKHWQRRIRFKVIR